MANNLKLTEAEEEQMLEMEQQMQIFGHDLSRIADEQVSLKAEIERRWINDLRHYNGRYDRDTEQRLSNNKNKTATIFVNMTRSRTNMAESKLSDMILPTDDKNWGIKPTPVPELMDESASEDPLFMADGTKAVNPENDKQYTHGDLANEKMKEARKKSEAMQREIDDQLKESRYNHKCRDVIHNGCVIGTGILKGPMVTKNSKRKWSKVGQEADYQLVMGNDPSPTADSVDPWNFFPEMAATCWEDVGFTYERHLMTKKNVRKLLNRPGFMKGQVITLLKTEPQNIRSNLSYLNEIREINGVTQIQSDNRYEVWEYHGPIDKGNMIACGCDRVDEDDPLEEYEGTVWFSNNIVLKVGLNHMDDDSLPYSVFNWEGDDTSVFGFGVPYRMRGSQKVMNGSWRMLLDNAALSTGPQIVINRKAIIPADGVWELSSRKLWYLNNEKYKVKDAFETFSIDSHQAELAEIFNMAHTLAEQETNVPQLGAQMNMENQPAMMKTLGGTALWMSSQNVAMRRAVKSWDDDITIPFITRMYDWNMQFSQKREIKGDYEVDARGTSVLLVREMQQRAMMEAIQVIYMNPAFVKRVDEGKLLESLVKSMQLTEEGFLLTEEEYKAKMKQEGENPPPDPDMMKLQMQEKLAQMSMQETKMNLEGMMQKAAMDREVALTRLASDQQMSLTDMRRKYDLEDIKTHWDREKFYRELQVKYEEGQTANYGLE
jgi:hypothetical protein